MPYIPLALYDGRDGVGVVDEGYMARETRRRLADEAAFRAAGRARRALARRPTALHLCAARGLHAMARGLLDHGADPSRRTVSGSSPLDRARLFRDDRLARVLELAAATPPASPTN